MKYERLTWLGVATLSGTLWFLSCANFDIWPLAWFASVPSLFAIERASTKKRAVLYGWWTGLVANAGGFYWITTLLERFGHLPAPVAIFAYLLLSGYQAVVFLFFAWVVRVVRARFDVPMALVAPVVMVAFELVVWMMLPWYLGITQAWNPHVIQIAELTGPLGVTALLMMVNGAIYDVASTRGVRWKPAAISAAILGGALLFGHVRIKQMEARIASAPHIKVGLVQGNVAFDEKGYEHADLGVKQLGDLQRLSAELEREGADLVVWTESSYPYWIPRTVTEDRSNHSIRWSDPIARTPIFKAPLVLGAVTYTPGHELDEDPYNSALMESSDGKFTGRFDKMYLMLFSEHIPLVDTFPFIKKILPKAAGNFTRGKGATTFPFSKDGKDYRLGPMICLEDIIPEYGRAIGKLHPHLLVNITNDAWFGATSEPWEHMALSVYRAVEERTELVRAVNTGVSAHIDLTGRVVEQTYANDPDVSHKPADKLLVDVALVEGGHTVYAVVGDLFGYLCALLTLVALLVARYRRPT
jgi:apolipoprotein N-acyltransferase